VKLQDPPPNNNPPPPPPTVDPLPTAPTGVKAVAKSDGSVAVSWNAVAGTGVRYSVQVDGAPTAQAAGTTSSLTGLTVGHSYVVTVSATNAAGSGPVSAGVTVTPFGAASAPRNARVVRHEAGGQAEITLFWDAPDLGGGDLVGYQVTGPGGEGGAIDKTVTQQGAAPLQFNDFDTYCTPTIRYQVRAITTPPGGGKQIEGAAAAASLSNGNGGCTPGLVLDSATATSSSTATVTFHCTGSGGGNVELDAKGTSQQPGLGGGAPKNRQWTGTCAGTAQQVQSATLTGLTASTPLSPTGGGTRYTTTYVITGTVTSTAATKPATNSLSFDMPSS
jgi:hypothetical protein